MRRASSALSTRSQRLKLVALDMMALFYSNKIRSWVDMDSSDKGVMRFLQHWAEDGNMEFFTAIFCCSPNLEILLAPPADTDKNPFGLGHQAICHNFLEAHNPKSPK